jgi:hypothetical protein
MPGWKSEAARNKETRVGKIVLRSRGLTEQGKPGRMR